MKRLIQSRMVRLGFASSLCVALLTSCSWLNDWPPGGEERAQAPAPQGQEQVVKTADATWLAPASGNSTPEFKSVQSTPLDGDTIARLAQLEQNMNQIRNDINTMMPALTRMASAQTDLHHSLANIQPAAGGQAAVAVRAPVQSQQQAVVTAPVRLAPAQTQTQAASYATIEPAAGAVAPPKVAPEPVYENGMRVEAWVPDRSKKKNRKAKNKTQPVAPSAYIQPASIITPAPVPSQPAVTQRVIADVPAPSATIQPVAYGGGGSIVQNIRFGEHSDKTRIVLDVSDNVSFRYDLDAAENLLLVELPGASWNSTMQRAVQSSAMVSSYQATSDGKGGTQLAIQLRQPARVAWAQALSANGSKGPRIVIDVASIYSHSE